MGAGRGPGWAGLWTGEVVLHCVSPRGTHDLRTERRTKGIHWNSKCFFMLLMRKTRTRAHTRNTHTVQSMSERVQTRVLLLLLLQEMDTQASFLALLPSH